MTVTVGAGVALPSGAYFGRILRRGGAAGFAATETSYRAGEDLPPHAHERAFFCLTLSGAYTERTGSSKETLYAPFTAVFHPAGEAHVTRMTSAGGRIFNVEIDPALLDLAGGAAAPPSRDLHGGPLVWRLARLRRASHAADADQACEAESLALELLGAVCRAQDVGRAEPSWLLRIVERIRDDPAPRFSVAALALEAGVHPVHLARVFRRHHGETIASFARRVRVQRAAGLLAQRETHLGSIAVIASASGFADQSHMTRAFRRVAGTTPAVLRQDASFFRKPACVRAARRASRDRSRSS
jgi:AraC family transcriptional regulator